MYKRVREQGQDQGKAFPKSKMNPSDRADILRELWGIDLRFLGDAEGWSPISLGIASPDIGIENADGSRLRAITDSIARTGENVRDTTPVAHQVRSERAAAAPQSRDEWFDRVAKAESLARQLPKHKQAAESLRQLIPGPGNWPEMADPTAGATPSSLRPRITEDDPGSNPLIWGDGKLGHRSTPEDARGMLLDLVRQAEMFPGDRVAEAEAKAGHRSYHADRRARQNRTPSASGGPR